MLDVDEMVEDRGAGLVLRIASCVILTTNFVGHVIVGDR